MYAGAYQLGDRLPLHVMCVDGDGAPAVPDQAPSASIYNSSGVRVFFTRLPQVDAAQAPGLFAHSIHLDSRFTTGYYTVWYAYEVSGDARVSSASFEVVPGGDADGTVISMHSYRRPQAEFLVYQTDMGKLYRGSNPRVR